MALRNRRSTRSGTPCSATPWTAPGRAPPKSDPTAFHPARPPRALSAPTAQSAARARAKISRRSLRRLQRWLILGFGLCRPRRADAQPPIGQRQAAAEKHDDGAEPDHQHMRLEEEPHRNGAVRIGVAEREIKLAET